MEVISGRHIIAPGSVAATIGMFDGVHRGHAMLIGYLNRLAHERGLKSAVITFREHPQRVLRPDTDLQMIMPLADRIKAIGRQGADYVIPMDFDLQLARLDSFNYIKLIRDNYGVQLLVTGFNHRFGHNRSEGFDDYVRHGKALGVELVQADEYRGPYSPVSSSIIRRLILAGKVDDAACCLGHPFMLHALVIPHRGAYTVRVKVADGQWLGGMANIGVRPTMGNGGHRQSIEVHIFDFAGDIYGSPISVQFVKFLRTELKLGSVDELRQQLVEDRTRSLQILQETRNNENFF